MPVWLCVVVLAGCGRIAFDPIGDGGGRVDAPVFALDAGECPPGYMFVGASCYRVVLDAGGGGAPWHEAETLCEADAAGAHLVVIDDATEAATIDSFVPSNVSDHWIGVSDVVTQDTYLTVTNRTPTYLMWEATEPNGTSGEDCLLMDDARTLHDTDCDASDDYVCEYDGIAAVPAAYTP